LNGGSTITAYTATCVATGQTTRSASTSGSSSMVVVQGMTINVTYNCSVTATNSIGTSSASASLPVTPAASYSVPVTSSSVLTGLWWNETESGWGISVNQHDSMIFAAWFTYDQAGHAIWYVMPSCPILGNACTGDLFSVTGGKPFVMPWGGAVSAVSVGTGILSFANESTGVLNFSINGAPGSKSITRQMFMTGTTAPTIDYSDLWWNPAESGWGVSLSQQYDTIFVTMFGYDSIGNPAWYVASNCKVAGSSCSGDLYQVAGGTRPTTTWSAASLAVSKVGFIEFLFADRAGATMNFFINGAAGTKQITRQSF
jgi:hypothetical protein